MYNTTSLHYNFECQVTGYITNYTLYDFKTMFFVLICDNIVDETLKGYVLLCANF